MPCLYHDPYSIFFRASTVAMLSLLRPLAIIESFHPFPDPPPPTKPIYLSIFCAIYLNACFRFDSLALTYDKFRSAPDYTRKTFVSFSQGMHNCLLRHFG